MADLDDFFAKKDRKKKAVKKFATADELAKKLEDTKQKTDVRPKKERPVQEGEEGGRAGEEEEWKEYEEPVKDYTGLKIQVLQGGNGAPESGGRSESEDSAPDGSGKGKGPWNKPVSSYCYYI
ncbi:protein CDV3 homolog [Ostrinia nubilalis]|uniref:protein CDV3 homolog n=1 Tax=Ostrinia nubilalis TaxID=29057 RepID=UPI00308262D0